MKLTLENPSRMVLKDHSYTNYAWGGGFFVLGAGLGILTLGVGNLVITGVAALFAVVGLGVVVSTKMLTVTLDKGTGKGTISLRGIIGGGSRDIELSNVRKLLLRKTTSSSKNGTIHTYNIGLVMDTNEELPFKLASKSAGLMDVINSPDEKEKKDAQQIADFLGVPMEFVSPPIPNINLGQAFSALQGAFSGGMNNPGMQGQQGTQQGTISEGSDKPPGV